MARPLSCRTALASFGYSILSLTLVFFRNEGSKSIDLENLILRCQWISSAYYVGQMLLMLSYLRFQRLGLGISLLVVVVVAALRTMSSGVAILTVAIVMGREMVLGRSSG